MPKPSPPISRICPRCGSEKSVQVSSSAVLRYSTDRRCTGCQKTYTLPAPKWAGVFFLVAGALFTGGCLWVFVVQLLGLGGEDNAEHIESSMYYGLTCTFLMGGIGVMVIIHGLRLLRQKPVEPFKPTDPGA